MATATQLSIDEYLSITYRPDCDFIDDHIEERNVGKFDHSNLQRALIGYLYNREREWNVRVLPEQRLRVSPTRVRIPDVCILSRDQPIEQVFSRPPLVCIEILSEGDTLNSTRPRLIDYNNFGVLHCWVFNPELGQAWRWTSGDYQAAPGQLTIPGSPIAINLPTLFALLD